MESLVIKNLSSYNHVKSYDKLPTEFNYLSNLQQTAQRPVNVYSTELY